MSILNVLIVFLRKGRGSLGILLGGVGNRGFSSGELKGGDACRYSERCSYTVIPGLVGDGASTHR